MARGLMVCVVMVCIAAVSAVAGMQSSSPGQAGPAIGGSGGPSQPESRDARATTLTGRIIVKFTEESGLIAPMAPAPFPIASDAGDSVSLNAALIATGSTVSRWIAQPDEVLLELMARAEANSGKRQPDLRGIAYIDPPSGKVLDTSDKLRGLEGLEWVYVERELLMAQACPPQGCGLSTNNCWEPLAGQRCNTNPNTSNLPSPPAPCPLSCCADAACCARVSAILPTCCDVDSARGWDEVCAQIANIVCEGDPADDYDVTAVLIPDAYPLMLGDCFTARPFFGNAYRGGCNNAPCAFEVCVVDPYCCTLEWDSACVERAASPAMRQFCGSPTLRESTPDFTASIELVSENYVLGGLGGGATLARQVERARGLQVYTVGEPVVGLDRFLNVVEPAPGPGGVYTGGLAFLNSGYRGGGLDLDKMEQLAVSYSETSGSVARLHGAGVKIGVIDFAYDTDHEEFVCAAQVANSPTGECAELYEIPRVIPEPGQTPYGNLPAAERGHGTAVLAMLVAGDNGFGVTGIAHEAQGYFFPAASVEQGFRLQNAFVSMLLEFAGGDVCVVPLALAPDGGLGPNEIFSQPIVTAAPYATLISVGSDIGILTVVPAGNSSAPVAAQPDGIESQALVVAASMPGQVLKDLIYPFCWTTREFTRNVVSNFTTPELPQAIDLFAWGSDVVTAGGIADLFVGASATKVSYSRRAYTKSFGGTSAASAMIGGAAAVLQSFAAQELGVPASPRVIGRVMRNNGVPQGGYPFNGQAPGDFLGVSLAAASVFPAGPVGGDVELVQARLGFSDFNRANFPQLVEAANDLIFEANDCAFVGLDPAVPDVVSPELQQGIEIDVTLGGGIGDGETCSWFAVGTEPWINVTTATGTGGQLDNIIRYDIEANNETIGPREGSIIFIGGNVTVVIPIVQTGCALTNVPGPLVFPPDGTTTGFGVPFDVALGWNGDECGWTAETADDWISATTASGTGGPPGNVLSFDVATNPLASLREGEITVTSTAGVEYRLEVVQEACALIDFVGDTAFGADGTTAGFGDPAVLELNWNGESCGWIASTTTPWITVLTAGGTGLPPDNRVRFGVAPNPGQVPRQGFIRITSEGGTFVNILVTQGACFLFGFVPPDPVAFGADGTTGGFGDPGQVQLNWNGEDCTWTASTTDSWITVLTASGTGAPLDNIIQFDVAPNPSQLPRNGRIRVVSGGGTEEFYVITQGACFLTDFGPNPVPQFGPDGTEGVAAAVDLFWSGESCVWTATTTFPWITLVTASGGGSPPNNVVEFEVAPNPVTQVARFGRITVTSAGGQVSQIDITQGPCQLNNPPPPILIPPDGFNLQQVALDWNGGSCGWVASTTSSWIVPIQFSGTGDGFLEFAVQPNTAAPFRAGVILITSQGGDQVSLVVQQDACQILAATPNQFNLQSPGVEGAQINLLLSGSECVWTASASQPWIVVTAASGSGAAGANVVRFNVAPNTGTSARAGVITITGGNGQSQSVSVSQEGQQCYDVAYTVVTGTQATSYASSRLEFVDDVPVTIAAQQGNAGGVYQGLTYLSGGKVTDIIFQTVYGGVNAPPPGQPFTINGLIVRNRAYSTNVSTMRVIYLKNRNTGAWTYLATDTMPVNAYPNGNPPWQSWALNAAVDPLLYVNPTTGRVDVRIWTVVLGSVSSNTVNHDYIYAGPLPLPFTGGAEVEADPESAASDHDNAEQLAMTAHTRDAGCVPVPVSETPIRIGAAGVEWAYFEVLLASEQCPWIAVSESEWIEILPPVVVVGSRRNAVEFAVEAFDGSQSDRTGWIRVMTGDGGWVRIPVEQAYCDVSESRNDRGDEVVSVESKGESGVPVSVGAVHGACSWHATTTAAWVRLVLCEGLVSDTAGYLIVDVLRNAEAVERTATISVMWDNGEQRDIVVRQSGATAAQTFNGARQQDGDRATP